VLADRANLPPWYRPEWFAAWSTAFTGPAPAIRIVRRAGILIGVLPVAARRRGYVSLSNWHTPKFGIVTTDHDAIEVATALLEDSPQALELRFVEAENVALLAYRAALLGGRYRILTRHLEHSPYIDLSVGWEPYLSSLAPKVLGEIRRRRRRLAEQGEVSLDVTDGSADLDELLMEGFRVEAAGWKGERGSAILSRAATSTFYSKVAEWAAKRGWLRLAFLRLDARPFAFDFSIEYGGVHYLLKTGYDPAFSRFAPGMLLRLEMIQRAFTIGLSRYDFLGADESWKLQWASSVRERLAFQAFAPSAQGILEWATQMYGRPVAKRAVAFARR